MTIKEEIESRLGRITGLAGDFLVDIPDRKITDADYFTNIAFLMAQNELKRPQEIAPILANEIKESLGDILAKVDIAGGGFINLWLRDDVLQEEIGAVLKKKKKYGSSKIAKGKIQVEYVSANPTGPLTLANGRGGFYGDVLSNLLKFSGAKVEREYYVNDTGNQILTLGKSMIAALGFIGDSDKFYRGDYVKRWAEENAHFVEEHQGDPMIVGEEAAKHFLSLIKKVLEEKSGIHFDRFTSEKNIHRKGLVRKALRKIKESGFAYESEGALWLKTTEFGDDKDRVLVTSDNFSTYILADTGHYFETLKRGFKSKILVLGPDHYGYVKRIEAISRILGLRESEVVITQAILVKRGKEFVKMSKRKGEFVTFESLVDEVGVNVARFFFLMVGTQSHLDFDLDLAKERSSKNPVFYVEYAYVRAKKILAKAGVGGDGRIKAKNLGALNSPSERKLMSILSSFPDVVKSSTRNREVHHLTKYALDAARAFHNFYEKERVIGEKDEIPKLALVSATAVVFQNLFRILGIVPPEEM